MSILHCSDCQAAFEFTEGEQKFYSQQGFTPPKRCPSCRKLKKLNSQGKKSWDKK